MTSLDGKVAIVTGAAGSLGAGMAQRLAAEGALVTCVDVQDTTPVVDSLENGTAAQVDVTDRQAVESLISSTVDRHGHLDIICNNAGVYNAEEIVDATDEAFERQFRVNTWAPFVACRAAGRVMKAQDSGRIINTASQLGKVGRQELGVYCASKAAVILMTQTLALELGPFGITANCICPGTMQSRLMLAADGRPAEEVASDRGVAVDDVMRDYIDERIPVGRVGKPSDVGALAAWLATDDAAFVNGASLNLSGGEQVFF